MAALSANAEAQITALGAYFLNHDKDVAASRLIEAVVEAVARIDRDPKGGKPWPATYRSLERFGFRWLKVHRYWFAWLPTVPEPIITNVLFESADIPRRILPSPNPTDM